MGQFPSLKARQLRRVLERKPFEYGAASSGSGGSHNVLTSPNDYPTLLWSFHDNQTLAPGLVRKILVKDVGLSVDRALSVISGRKGR